MEISDIDSFLAYYAKVKGRTRKLFALIPEDKMEWTYHADKFTFGDIIRHLAAIERYMYAENVQLRPTLYRGCSTDLADGYQEVINYYDRLHEESMAIFRELKPEHLLRKCTTPNGTPITTWKWLRAMVEHEVHHRGQIYTYLGMLEVGVPPIYGLTSEEVARRSDKNL